jgi:uncharacterized protein YkwD
MKEKGELRNHQPYHMEYNKAVRTRRLCAICVLLAAWGARPLILPAREAPAPRQIAVPSSSDEIERELLQAINRERVARNIPVLRSNPELVRLARKQSADMAGLNDLSHVSASGKSFTERLAEAAITFAANGENVARIDTFVADLIHRSFMESPGHRERVLDPAFDEAGIGIFQADMNAYYVTEDFIRSLVPKTAAEVRGVVAGVLDEIRAENNLPPVILIDEVNRTAEALARDQAAGGTPPPGPLFSGETFMLFVSGPDLNVLAAMIRDKCRDPYGWGGIGVQFGRSPDYPGGAYFLCVISKKS